MKPLNRLISYTVAHVTLAALFSIFPLDSAFSQADFYSGKTITIIRGGGPGGSGEFQTRSLMRVLGKHIPGRPSFTLQYVDGAAGRKATNVIYSSTRPDGLTIGSIGAGLVVGPILGSSGQRLRSRQTDLPRIDGQRRLLYFLYQGRNGIGYPSKAATGKRP